MAERTGDRERLREIPMMLAIKPDVSLIDEWAEDAVKASRYAQEATLRVLSRSFEEQIAERSSTTPTLVLAGMEITVTGYAISLASL